MVTTLLAMALGTTALAQTDGDVAAGNLQFLIGAGAMPLSGDPATFVLGALSLIHI